MALLTGQDWGFGLQPAWVFLLLAIICQLLGVLTTRVKGDPGGVPPISFGKSPVLRLVTVASLAILLVVLLSAWGIKLAPSAETSRTVWFRFGKQVAQLFIMLAFVIWPLLWTRGQARWRFTILMLSAGVGIQILYGLIQGWHYYYPGMVLPPLERVFTSNPAILSGSEDLYVGNTFQNIPRLRGTVCEPLYLGNYLLMTIPWLVWARRDIPWGRVLLLGSGVLLILTWSRGAWLGGLGQGLVLLVLWGWVRSWTSVLALWSRKTWWVLGLGFLLLLAGFWFSDWPAFSMPRLRLMQTFSTADWSNLTRFYSMQAGWRAFLLSPVVGVGWGQFSFHFPMLVDPMGLQSQFSWPVVNNFPLKILAETGLIGFVTFLGLSGLLFFRGGFSYRRTHYGGLLAALVAVAGVWLQLLTFSQYNLPHIWVGVGLLGAMILDIENLPGNHPADNDLAEAKE